MIGIYVIKAILSIWIIRDDLKSQEVMVLPLFAWMLLSLVDGLTIGALIYGLIYFLFWLNHRCGMADVILISSACRGLTLMECAWLNLLSCILGLIFYWSNHKKGKDPLPFTPAILLAYWILMLQQFIQ